MDKAKRQEQLLKALGEYEFNTQNELVEHLNEMGLCVTQATVSRDIKELKVVKISGKEKKYRYAKLEDDSNSAKMYKTAVISVTAAQNLIVIKTTSGTANAVASFIDNAQIDGIIGSIAGDDACLLITADNESANLIKSKLDGILK